MSVLVPIGFILSLILGLVLLDGHAEFPVYGVFVPLLASIIFSYLYVRCLIKPSEFGKVKPEANNLNSSNQNIGNSQQLAAQDLSG